MTKRKKEMTVGELAKKLSSLSGDHKEMTLSELVKFLVEETTVGALLNRLESYAGYYYQDAVASIERNSKYHGLRKKDLEIDKRTKQRIVNAVLIDFINHASLYCGRLGDRRIGDLAKAFKKNQKARKKIKE